MAMIVIKLTATGAFRSPATILLGASDARIKRFPPILVWSGMSVNEHQQPDGISRFKNIF